MGWSGSTYRKGNYSTNGWTGDAASGIGIEAGRHDVQDDDFAQGITDCINKNGLNTPTTNLSMGGKRHTNVDAAASSTDYARFDQVMDRAGTQAATANLNIGGFKLTNLANGTASSDAATYGQLTTTSSVNTPTGVINMYGGSTAPTGWLICNGAAVSRTTYSALFAILSTTYGAGDGSSTFNIPDLQQRFPLGKAASGTGSTLGGTGGAIDHTHTVYAHYHSATGTGATITTTTTGSGHGHSHTLATSSAGDHAHTYSRPTTSVAVNTGGVSVWDNTVTTANTNTTGAHTHPITGSIGGSDGTHTHTITGLVGKVTAGLNGDIDQATSSNNPPYLVVNYIIKT